MNIKKHNIKTDVYKTTPIVFHATRDKIYKKSSIITNLDDGDVMEIFGHLDLEDRYRLWDEYGEPTDFLYFSIESGEICGYGDACKEEDHFMWCIGWIAESGVVFIFVDILNLMSDYHNHHSVNASIENIDKLVAKGKEKYELSR